MAKIFGNTTATTIPIKEGQAPFYVTVTSDTSGVYSADKTYEEIYAAYQEGKHILVKELSAYEGGAAYEYHLSAVEGGYLYFTVIHWATIPWANEFVCDPNNTWYKNSKTLEVKENKVSTISLRNPTDYNYPSEKAVAEYVKSKTTPFVIEAMYDYNGTKTFTTDATFADIQQAVADGKNVILRMSYDYTDEMQIIPLVAFEENVCATFAIVANRIIYTIKVNEDIGWGYREVWVDEKTYVSQLGSAVAGSTIPTANAVMTYVNSAIGEALEGDY
jgi:hypothetical protein